MLTRGDMLIATDRRGKFLTLHFGIVSSEREAGCIAR
jgi:hypothetical protein